MGELDATNSTRARRKALADRIAREPGLKLIFIESLCTDPAVIAANIAVKVASGDPDYDGQEPEQAEKDFRERIKHYEDSYEPLEEREIGTRTMSAQLFTVAFFESQGQTGGKRKRERRCRSSLRRVKTGKTRDQNLHRIPTTVYPLEKIVSVSLSLARDDKERKEIVGAYE